MDLKDKTQNTVRPIYEIAQEISNDWSKINYGAKPYLNAMLTLNSIDDSYGYDSASSIIRYFLVNSQTWRGDTARGIKLELNDILKNEN